MGEKKSTRNHSWNVKFILKYRRNKKNFGSDNLWCPGQMMYGRTDKDGLDNSNK